MIDPKGPAQLNSSEPFAVAARARVPVLIVDDNAAKRLALRSIVEPLGYEIVEADSGIAGLRCAIAQDFAVILLDVRMPVMDGFETAALLRAREQSEMTPIIFITAHDRGEIGPDLYSGGAVDFMFAPVAPDELRAKVSFFASLFVRAEQLALRSREVQASADQLRLLTDVAPIGIFLTDENNCYVYTNPRWSEITGISPGDANGCQWDFIIDAEERARLYSELPDGDYRQEVSHRFEMEVTGGDLRTLVATSRSMQDGESEITGWVGTLADTTTEASAEEALSVARDDATEASRLKSDFLANMSHEIRTPMNGVIGMTDLLLESDLSSTQRDYAQTVRTSGEALLAILNDILDFSKVEAGQLEIEHIDLDVRAVAAGVVDLLEGPARSKGLELAAVVDDSVPTLVSSDPGRVRQVLINLVGNAIKFTEEGRVTIRVTQAKVAGGEVVVSFDVSDTGPGIPADKLDLIFEPFIQADSSTSRKHGGTGLGLAISSQLVALLGGRCGVTSVQGEGSNFWFTISDHARSHKASTQPAPPPHADTVDALSAASSHQSPPPGEAAVPGRILLAEDNPVNRRVATAMLEHLGYDVDVATDGAAAVRAAASTQYQAILMDCQMPVHDGYEATSQIRHQQGVDTHTPIIAVTASAMKADRQRCLAAGMDDYLPKPLSLKALAAVLDRWVLVGPIPRAANKLDSDPSEPALNAESVARLVGLGGATGEDFMQQLATLFLADADGRVTALGKALDADDGAAVALSAHALRGASANLGANHLASLCATMENGGVAGDLGGSGQLLKKIEAELGRVRLALG